MARRSRGDGGVVGAVLREGELKRKSRFELRDAWVQRQKRESPYVGNLLINADVENIVGYAFLMGYQAREKQDHRRRRKQAETEG
jgi:hypothetical protein